MKNVENIFRENSLWNKQSLCLKLTPVIYNYYIALQPLPKAYIYKRTYPYQDSSSQVINPPQTGTRRGQTLERKGKRPSSHSFLPTSTSAGIPGVQITRRLRKLIPSREQRGQTSCYGLAQGLLWQGPLWLSHFFWSTPFLHQSSDHQFYLHCLSLPETMHMCLVQLYI